MQLQSQYRLVIAGALSSVAYVYLAINSQEYGQAALNQFLAVSSFCAIMCLWAYVHHHNNNVAAQWSLIFAFALIFRAIALFAFPILEDDIFRYMWDGRMTIENGSPYGLIPAHFFDVQLNDEFEEILGSINYPYIATVYGPVCQWVFALAYKIAPGQVWPFQLTFIIADIVLILTLSRLTKPLMVMLYAWSPLIIKEFAFTAHPDVLGAMFLLLAYMAYQKRAFAWVGLMAALATGVKVFAIVLVPFLLGWQWRGWLVFFTVAIGIALPFGVSDAWIPAGLKAMSDNWLFNAPIYTALLFWLPVSTIKTILLSLFLVIGGAYGVYAMKRWWFDGQPISVIRADLLFAGLFLVLPALNPWYFVWLLPFAALRPSLNTSLWAWAASVFILLSYASGINLKSSNLGPYEHYYWLLLLEFSLIIGAIIIQFWLLKKNTQTTQ